MMKIQLACFIAFTTFGCHSLVTVLTNIKPANAQLPNIGIDLQEEIKKRGSDLFESSVSDNSGVALRNIRSVKFYPNSQTAEVRVREDRTYYYLAENDEYQILFDILEGRNVRGIELLLALDGDGVDTSSSFVSQVWISEEDLELFEADYDLYLDYNLDSQAYRASEEYKEKLNNNKQ